MPFPGTLVRGLLNTDRDNKADPGQPSDPWEPESLALEVLQQLKAHAQDSALAGLAVLAESADPQPGKTRAGAQVSYSQARHIADLFDRYSVHRPDMIRQWNMGNDIAPDGSRIGVGARWQPYLWRVVRAAIDQPSPAERLPEVLNLSLIHI